MRDSNATSNATVERLWIDIRSAFMVHGKRLGVEISDARARVLRARLRDCRGNAERVVAAVHGYILLRKSSGKGAFDWKRYFTPETVFRPSHFDTYVEAHEGRSCNATGNASCNATSGGTYDRTSRQVWSPAWDGEPDERASAAELRAQAATLQTPHLRERLERLAARLESSA